jgi:CheY-like chemotaxis protein
MRVLVVDDSEDATELLGVMLEQLGYEHNRAHSGAEALRAFEAHRPDVVLLDLGLPDMDGCAVAQEMQKVRPNAVLVAVTGYGDDRTIEAVRHSGFARHLLKPVQWPVLEDLLAQAQAQLAPASRST